MRSKKRFIFKYLLLNILHLQAKAISKTYLFWGNYVRAYSCKGSGVSPDPPHFQAFNSSYSNTLPWLFSSNDSVFLQTRKNPHERHLTVQGSHLVRLRIKLCFQTKESSGRQTSSSVSKWGQDRSSQLFYSLPVFGPPTTHPPTTHYMVYVPCSIHTPQRTHSFMRCICRAQMGTLGFFFKWKPYLASWEQLQCY